MRIWLALAVVLCLGPGLVGGFVWDDHQLIGVDAGGRDGEGIVEALTTPFFETRGGVERGEGYYRPVLKLAYALQRAAFGLDAFGYHVVSLLLHLLCVWLAFDWLRRRLSPETSLDTRHVLAAGLAAAVFAVHPTRPESVTWISGSTDLWMTLFALLALRAFERRTRLGVVAGAALLALSLLAKEASAILPLCMAADALLLPRSAGERRADLRSAAVAAVAVVAVLLVRFSVVAAPSRMSEGIGEAALPRVVSSFGHYLAMTFAPVDPSAMRALVALDAGGAPTYAPWSVALGALGLLGLVALAAVARRRPAARPALADAVWFVAALGPVLNVLPLGLAYLVADRYLYLPLLGPCALLSRGALAVLERRGRARVATVVLGALSVVGLSAVSLEHVGTFLDDGSLWAHEAERNPDNALAFEMLTYERLAADDLSGAIDTAERGLAAAERLRHPTSAARLLLLRATLDAQATADANQGRLAELSRFFAAVAAGEGAELRIGESTHAVDGSGAAPDPVRVLVPWARLRSRQGEHPAAVTLLERARDARPDSWQAWSALAQAQARGGDFEGARASIARAQAAPRSPGSLRELSARVDEGARARGGGGRARRGARAAGLPGARDSSSARRPARSPPSASRPASSWRWRTAAWTEPARSSTARATRRPASAPERAASPKPPRLAPARPELARRRALLRPWRLACRPSTHTSRSASRRPSP